MAALMSSTMGQCRACVPSFSPDDHQLLGGVLGRISASACELAEHCPSGSWLAGTESAAVANPQRLGRLPRRTRDPVVKRRTKNENEDSLCLAVTV